MSPARLVTWVALFLCMSCASSSEAENGAAERARDPDSAEQEAAGRESAAQEPAALFEPGVPLTLAESLAVAERNSLELQTWEARSRAGQARLEQAGRRLNPELELGAEAIPTEGSSLDEAEYLVGLGQDFRLGDVRGRAQDVERRRADALDRERRTMLEELHRRVRGAFATALFSERVYALQEARVELRAELLGVLQARREFGDADGAEVTEGELDHLEAENARAGSRRLASEARRELAVLLFCTEPDLPPLAGDLDLALEVPSLESLVQRLQEHPEILAAIARTGVATAEVDLEEAERIPEVHLGLFYRRMQGERLHAFDLEFAMPLRFFDGGEQRVEQARWEAVEARLEEDSVRRATEAQLRRTHARLSWALELHRRQDQVFRPRAEALLRDMQRRNALGDVRRTQVMTAQSALLDVQESLLESRREAVEAWAELAPFLTR